MKKINEGWCAELFEADNGKLLKLYKDGWSEAQVRTEYENTKSANALGIPSPRVYEFTEQDGRYGFVMDKLAGETMLQMIQKKPLSAISLATQMARLQFCPIMQIFLYKKRFMSRRSTNVADLTKKKSKD